MKRLFHPWKQPLLLQLILLFLLAGCSDDDNNSGLSGPDPEQSLSALESQIIELTNIERSDAGLAGLEHDSGVAQTARAHSEDMLSRDYFAHENPDGESAADRFDRIDGRAWRYYAENIFFARGFSALDADAMAAQIVQAWMDSPGHRDNILASQPTVIGVGVALAGDTLYATQNFAAFP